MFIYDWDNPLIIYYVVLNVFIFILHLFSWGNDEDDDEEEEDVEKEEDDDNDDDYDDDDDGDDGDDDDDDDETWGWNLSLPKCRKENWWQNVTLLQQRDRKLMVVDFPDEVSPTTTLIWHYTHSPHMPGTQNIKKYMSAIEDIR